MGPPEDKALLVVVTGPAGVGKSTVSRRLAAAFRMSAHVEADTFAGFIASGFVDQWRSEAAPQNEVLGATMAVSAMQFVEGGYTVLLDGHFFPDGFDGLARACALRGIPAHYVVLRAAVGTCRKRAEARGPMPDGRLLEDLHARYQDLGDYEANVVDAERGFDEVVVEILSGLRTGAFAPVTS